MEAQTLELHRCGWLSAVSAAKRSYTCVLESGLSEAGVGVHDCSLPLLLVCLRGLMSLLGVLATGSYVRSQRCGCTASQSVVYRRGRMALQPRLRNQSSCDDSRKFCVALTQYGWAE